MLEIPMMVWNILNHISLRTNLKQHTGQHPRTQKA
jgi:hypothetical protein